MMMWVADFTCLAGWLVSLPGWYVVLCLAPFLLVFWHGHQMMVASGLPFFAPRVGGSFYSLAIVVRSYWPVLWPSDTIRPKGLSLGYRSTRAKRLL